MDTSLFPRWTTPLVADAAMRGNIRFLVLEEPLVAVIPGTKTCGPARPVRHYGSVDVFLEAIDEASRGDVLVIDNQGRADEGCIGDLVTIEAQVAGLAGLVCWGRHRDSEDIRQIGLPVFSLGTCPAGPRTVRPRTHDPVLLGSTPVTRNDFVFADEDGVVVVSKDHAARVLNDARSIFEVERRQAEMVRSGRSLREQFRFPDYVARRAADAGYTFRMHLRRIGGEIEE
jgi:regulator of RNase E activity RraA